MSGRLDPEPISRRDFLGLAGLLTAGLAIFGSLLAMLRLPVPRVLPEASTRFRVGSPLEFPAGAVTILAERQVRIVSTDEGVAAMSLVCTHLGCIVGEGPTGFQCPCHGSKFDAQGKVVGGPGIVATDYPKLLGGSFKVITRGAAAPGFDGNGATANLQVTFTFAAFE